MQVAVSNQVVTMSSREIAELVGSTHDNVLKTVRSLIEQGVVFGNETPYVHPQNRQTYSEFHLNFRDTMIIVSGYSVKMRARIIDRWQELEAVIAAPVAPTLPDFTDPVIAARAWADQVEKSRALQITLAEQAPKADFYDKYTKATGNKGIREVAKLLHANEREFVTFLRTNNVVYRLNGRLMPYSHQQGALRLDVKAGVAENGQAFQQAVFTPKGIAWIAAEWAKYQAVEV